MADPISSKPSRLWRIVFVLSLALNLAVVGIVVGAASSGRWTDGPPPQIEVGLGPIGRALAPDERRDIRRYLIRQRALRDLNLRGGMRDIIAALTAEPFDVAQMENAMAAQISRNTALQQTLGGALLDVVSAMTPERRAAFAAELAAEMAKARSERQRPSGGG